MKRRNKSNDGEYLAYQSQRDSAKPKKTEPGGWWKKTPRRGRLPQADLGAAASLNFEQAAGFEREEFEPQPLAADRKQRPQPLHGETLRLGPNRFEISDILLVPGLVPVG